MKITYCISTSDVDIEDGYPEWEESCDDLSDLSEIVKRAENYGVPSHRLTVMESWIDDESIMQFNVLGSAEEILYKTT